MRSGTASLHTAQRDPTGFVSSRRGGRTTAPTTGRLEQLPYLEPCWRAEMAHAVVHLGLIGALRRLAPGRR